MPFDMTPTVDTDAANIYRRLCLLRELLPQSGDQTSFKTCAWSEVRKNKRMRELGVSDAPTPSSADASLFGTVFFFSGLDKDEKMVMLEQNIGMRRRLLLLQGIDADAL